MKILSLLMLAIALVACSTTPVLQYRQAPDSHAADYQTFSIQAIQKARGLNMPAMVKVGKAIKYALEQKGLRYVEQGGELLIEYGVGIRNVNSVNMHFYPQGLGTRTQHDVESATIAKMVININDVEQQRSIWLTSGSARINGEDKSQQEINAEFIGIFSNFE